MIVFARMRAYFSPIFSPKHKKWSHLFQSLSASASPQNDFNSATDFKSGETATT